MKKVILLTVLLLQIISITVFASTNKTVKEEDLVQIYSIAFNSFIPTQKEMMDNKNYIAVNMKTENFKEISEKGKQQILNSFKKYGISVVNESLGTLKEKELTGKHDSLYKNNLKGILFNIKDVYFQSDKEVVIEGSWYTTGTAGEGFISDIVYENGKWKLKDRKRIWIS